MENYNLFSGRFKSGTPLPRKMPDFKLGDPWKTPERLYDKFCEYVQFCGDNPMISVEIYGKDPDEFDVPKMRMLNAFGFCAFCYKGINSFEKLCKNEEFREVCEFIKSYMTNTNLTGAGAGMLSAVIVTRLEGLADKKELSNNTVTDVVFHVPKIESGNDTKLLDEAWEI